MNAAHLHLVLTHVPIFGCAVGLFLLLIGVGSRNQHLQCTGLWMFAITGALTVPTYLSGRPANALLSKLAPGMSMDPADQHAEVAVVALTLALLLAAAAAVTLVLGRKKAFPTSLSAAVLLLGMVTTATMVWTASLGGHIRHTEIRTDVDKPGL